MGGGLPDNDHGKCQYTMVHPACPPGQAADILRNFCFKSGQYSVFRVQEGIRPVDYLTSLCLLSGPWELFGFHSKLFQLLDEKSLTPL